MILLCRVAVLFALAVALVDTSATLADTPPVRIGILGIDNYQSVAFTQAFNNPKAEGDLAGVRVVAAYPIGSDDYPESAALVDRWKTQLTTLYQKPKNPEDAVPPVEMVDSIDALLARCDAVIIMSLDPRLHLQQAKPVLKAGKRLYIGRPLAATAEDAAAILQFAQETGTPCWSSSQHRFSPGFSGMRNHPEVGRVLGCDVYGGYDAKRAAADQFTRAIHSVETLYTIMGPGCATLSCVESPTAEVITARWNDGRIATIRAIKQGAVKYSATVFGDKGVSTAGVYGHGVPVKGVVPTTDKYMGYDGIAAEIAKFFKGGSLPVEPAETSEIFGFLRAMDESLRRGGESVPVTEVSATADKSPK